MPKLPKTQDMPVIRTDFSDQAAWEAACEAIRPVGGEDGFTAYVEFVDDPAFTDLTPEQIVALAAEDGEGEGEGEGEGDHVCVFVVDRVTLGSPECPVLVIDLLDEPGNSFRVAAGSLYMIENNLSLGNSDFADFAEGVDDDGVFRATGAPSPAAVFEAMRNAIQATSDET